MSLFFDLKKAIDTIYLKRQIINKKIVIGKNCNISGRIHVCSDQGTISIGDNVTINSSKWDIPVGYTDPCSFWIMNGGDIKIGDYCGLSHVTICAKESVIIGDYVLLGGGVKIYDTDFHSLDYNKRICLDGDDDRKSAPVVVKNGAFVGAGSIVLKGVTIGEKSIIGAGSVVAKSVPDGEIWAGNPAKFIRKIEG